MNGKMFKIIIQFSKIYLKDNFLNCFAEKFLSKTNVSPRLGLIVSRDLGPREFHFHRSVTCESTRVAHCHVVLVMKRKKVSD